MTEVVVSNIYVHCVGGWGWTQRRFQDADIEAVNELADISSSRGVLHFIGDDFKFMTISLAGDSARFGDLCMVFPLEVKIELSKRRIGVALLVFGNLSLGVSAEDIVSRFQHVQSQFQLPETRGYADYVYWENVE